MLHTEEFEQIHIAGAYCYNALAKVYIISADKDFSDFIKDKVVDRYKPWLYTAPFTFELIESADSIENKALADTVRENGYLAFVQVPDTDCPTFVTCKSGNDELLDFKSILKMMSEADYAFKSSFDDVLLDYALDFPEGTDNTLRNMAIGRTRVMHPIVPGGTISFGGRIKQHSEQKGNAEVTLAEAKRSFVDDVQRLQAGDTAVLSRVEMVIRSLSEQEKNKILCDYIKAMSEEGVKSFQRRYVDTNNILESSQISIWVKHSNSCIDNNGYYRVFYKIQNGEYIQLRFKHKPSCVVFLMHLLYNKQNGDVRKNLVLDENNRQPFIHIFKKVYDVTEQEAVAAYSTLMNLCDDESNKVIAQGRLKDYIADCNNVVNENILPFESSYPLIIKRNGFMPILNSKVHFEDDSYTVLNTMIV